MGWTSAAEAGEVCFFRKKNYNGKKACVAVTPGAVPQFGSHVNGTLGFKRNAIESITVPSTDFHGIWLFDEDVGESKSVLITQNTPDLGSMRNETSSWVIRNPGSANTKVRYFIKRVHYDGKDPDGAKAPDHLLFAKAWQGNRPTWKTLIGSVGQLASSNAWTAWTTHLDCAGGKCNYVKDQNPWYPAVVQDWNGDLQHQKQITFGAWDCGGTCTLGMTPDRWQQKPPCANGRCTQRSGAGVYPLGDLVLDLTAHRQWETVTHTQGPMTIELEIWKNEYHGSAKESERDPSRVSLVGSTQSYSPDQFEAYVRGMRFTNNPADEGDYALVGGSGLTSLMPGQCTIAYPEASGDRSSASVDIGALTCVVELTDGVTVAVTPVYGGCNIESRGAGSEASCEIGVFRATLTVEHSIPGCGEQICEFREEFTVNGPNAEACHTVTYDSYCQSAGVELVSAEVEVTDGNGNGVGAGVSIGVGAGAGVTVEDGVFQTSIELKLLAGAEISFSIGYEANAKLMYRLGSRGVMYAANQRQAMGKTYADVYRSMPGAEQGVKVFAGIMKARNIGGAVQFAKDVGAGIGSFATGVGTGTWKSSRDFFNSATSWIPKF